MNDLNVPRQMLHLIRITKLINFFNGWSRSSLSISSIPRHSSRHSSWHTTRHTSWHITWSSSCLVKVGNYWGTDSLDFLLFGIILLFRAFLVLIKPFNGFFTFVNHSFAVFLTDLIFDFFILHTLFHVVCIRL